MFYINNVTSSLCLFSLSLWLCIVAFLLISLILMCKRNFTNKRILLVGWLGVESFDVDLKEQKVTVKGNVEPEAVLQTVSKTGKKTSFWGADEAETAKA